jgi:alpha-methylacyl-CoA racemase
LNGPLSGVRVVEFAGIGPAPFACMMLADMGADILRIDRIDADPADDWWRQHDILSRGRRSIAVDLKAPGAVGLVLDLCERADALVEGYRPGALERLGLGPDAVHARNPRLLYGRMTGWGQDGPLAQRAGHDINYCALNGVLHSVGETNGPPIPPLNLAADFGGGGMLLAFGLVCGLLEAKSSGRGQVIDAAMIDGAALLMAWTWTLRNAGAWVDRRGSNLLDGGAPNYTSYETADGEYVAVGAMERQFFTLLLTRLGLPVSLADDIDDRSRWPVVRQQLADAFRRRTRAEWVAAFDGLDVCVTPVLSLTDAATDRHLSHRQVLCSTGQGYQPAAAPRFSRTAPGVPGVPTAPGAGGASALTEWGVDSARVAGLQAAGVVHITAGQRP